MYRNYDFAHDILRALAGAAWVGAAFGVIGAGILLSQSALMGALYSVLAAIACGGIVAITHVGRAILDMALDLHAAVGALAPDRQSRH